MYNHAPADYKCPICIGLQGIQNEHTLIAPTDFVYKDQWVSAFINSFFIGKNPGHVIVVPNQHYENIYHLPKEIGARIHEVAKKIAIALKETYLCDGITTQQNNEPAGGQHAYHYHFHVFPRYENDEFYKNILDKKTPTPEERKPYADKIKKYFASKD